MQNDLPDEWKLWISEGMRRGIAVADMQSAAQQRGLPLPLFESYVAQFRARARDRAQPGPLQGAPFKSLLDRSIEKAGAARERDYGA